MRERICLKALGVAALAVCCGFATVAAEAAGPKAAGPAVASSVGVPAAGVSSFGDFLRGLYGWLSSGWGGQVTGGGPYTHHNGQQAGGVRPDIGTTCDPNGGCSQAAALNRR